MSKATVIEQPITTFDPRVESCRRVRIKNLKSQRYLSVQGEKSKWGEDNESLSIRDLDQLDVLVSPQVWTIIHYRSDRYTLTNQYSKSYACIRFESMGDDATVVQVHSHFGTTAYQEWSFEPMTNGNWLIKNMHSGKYIGPQGRSTENDHFCIQYSNQTSEDPYQEWVFEPA